MSAMDKTALGFVSLLLLAIISPALGYFAFQVEIPNGNNVEHPCKVNYQWRGVGHKNPLGGGTRNVFGRDFKNAGSKWTKELCNKDSDGDGMTNGEELGDPECIWVKGQKPQRITEITHPGICNPFGVGKCEGLDTWVDCKVETMTDCDKIKEPDVKALELRFPNTTIPDKETNYFCMTFDLPHLEDYHIVAYEPIIDNAQVLHHMLIYGCDIGSDVSIPTPIPCGMSSESGSCSNIIAMWAIGSPGFCYKGNFAFRIGNTSYTRVKLETHYNNPKLASGYRDSSGMKIYYRPIKAGTEDLFVFVTGQRILEIPPTQSQVIETGDCPGSCTKKLFSKPVYVIGVINHMHYLGKSQTVELYRDGIMVADLGTDPVYSYDSPKFHTHTPPLEVHPGDEIRTTCAFNSISSDHWVYYGDGTSSEMCYAFITMYPASASRYTQDCIGFGPLSTCGLHAGTLIEGCDWKTFVNNRHPEMIKWHTALERNCNINGFCRPECKKTVAMLAQHPCMSKKNASKVIHEIMGRSNENTKFLSRFYSCKAEPDWEGKCTLGTDDLSPSTSVACHALLPAFIVFMTIVAMFNGQN